jgi:hypothetical protein
MAEIMTYDSTNDSVIMESIESNEAESLAIGEELMAQQEERLAGKYKDAKELEKAYLELQQKLGSRSDDEVEDSEPETEAEYEATEDEQVDFLWTVNDEIAETGEISEETLAKFDSMSSRDLVDAWMRYQGTIDMDAVDSAPTGRELSEAEVNEVYNLAGGPDEYQQLVGWAAENFTEEEVSAFDSVVESGNLAAIKLTLQALQYRYNDNMGYEGEMIQGKPAQSREIFRSQAELVRAMSDPRYDDDPAYRMAIMEKLERSGLEF